MWLLIPTSTNATLVAFKARHTLCNRDAVIGALARKARGHFRLENFSLPPEPADVAFLPCLIRYAISLRQGWSPVGPFWR